MIGALPTSLDINGKAFAIRTDFRDVLTIIEAFGDPELESEEKMFVCLYVLYKNFEGIKPDDYEEAYTKAVWFIDCGSDPKQTDRPKPRLMDWQQDEQILFPAIKNVAGFETRARKYIHWWTFMGYFMEIHDGVFSQVLALRQKKAKRKKLEKWEQEFWSANKDMCVLQTRLSEEEQKAKDRLNALLNN